MKRINFLWSFLMIALISFNACEKSVNDTFTEDVGIELNDQNGEVIDNEYIVVLNQGAFKKVGLIKGNYEVNHSLVRDEVESFVSKHQIDKTSIKNVYFNTIDGFSITADKATIERIKKDPDVK